MMYRGLPVGFRQVEYLQSSFNAAILTGIEPTATTWVRVDGLAITANSLFGVYGALGIDGYTIGSRQTYRGFWGSDNYYSDYDIGVRHVFDLDSGNLKIDGNLVYEFPKGTITGTEQIVLFGRSRNGNVQDTGTVQIYSAEIWDDGVTLRDYVPCVRKSDEAAGMYDMISGAFFGSYSIAEFTPGPEVKPIREVNLEPLNTFSVRYEVLRNKAVYAALNALTDSGEVTCDSASELKMSFRGTFAEPPDGVNFLTDRLRPVVILNGEEFPVGVYAITTESERNENGETVTELEGYSLLYLASRKCIETRLSIPAGTNYISECVQLLNSAGITDIDAEPTGYTLATAREDWDVGTPILTIVNDLLAEISYNSAWVALDGTVRLTKYAPPSLANVGHVYSEGRYSVIEDGYTRSSDRYGKYNVFLVTCENPDLSAPMSATAVNDSEESPFSVSKLGRILRVETVDNIPSQAALQEYANRMKYQSMQETETITFATAPIPNHETFDVVALGMGDLSGIYAETGWTLPLIPGGSMSHTARRVRSV